MIGPDVMGIPFNLVRRASLQKLSKAKRTAHNEGEGNVSFFSPHLVSGCALIVSGKVQ